ncbi:cellulose-binding domain-containing protein [Mycobacterium paraterrae]|uniref:Cellulose-binding domain-containing protein n=1 Tax=Mycobacterium paraterrae TaxID=577492 RepID=A0ABY3VRG2_9MYCO|nr:cellulose-binding domain-containing protein [Mycobacterium paraterrae]UMB72034.1 cellulose-binding domain-containing protein [Mycobacterium paraterrae]
MAEAGTVVERWRAALRLTVSAVMASSLGLAIAPVTHAAAATASLSVNSTWQTGFIARFAISNSSAVPLSDWRLEFDMPIGESISHTWNSTVAQSGTHYVLRPANWNRIIAPGGSATGGFRGVLTGSYVPPSNCLLNGQYPCT